MSLSCFFTLTRQQYRKQLLPSTTTPYWTEKYELSQLCKCGHDCVLQNREQRSRHACTTTTKLKKATKCDRLSIKVMTAFPALSTINLSCVCINANPMPTKPQPMDAPWIGSDPVRVHRVSFAWAALCLQLLIKHRERCVFLINSMCVSHLPSPTVSSCILILVSSTTTHLVCFRSPHVRNDQSSFSLFCETLTALRYG